MSSWDCIGQHPLGQRTLTNTYCNYKKNSSNIKKKKKTICMPSWDCIGLKRTFLLTDQEELFLNC